MNKTFYVLNFRNNSLLLAMPLLYSSHIVTQNRIVGGGSSRPNIDYIYQKSTMHMRLEHLFIFIQI